MKAAIAALALLAATPAHAAFDAVEFFRGRTHGDGILKIIFQSEKRISVDSFGVVEKDGTLVLKQTVRGAGKAPRSRVWRLRETAPNTYEGTLTDAASPVRIDVKGDSVRIRYRGKDHLDMDQTLEPVSPTEVHNHMRVKRFGITVARLEEVIRKVR